MLVMIWIANLEPNDSLQYHTVIKKTIKVLEKEKEENKLLFHCIKLPPGTMILAPTSNFVLFSEKLETIIKKFESFF